MVAEEEPSCSSRLPHENEELQLERSTKNSTGFTGVSRRDTGRFSAEVSVRHKNIRIGTYETAEEAAIARAKWILARRDEEGADDEADDAHAGARLLAAVAALALSLNLLSLAAGAALLAEVQHASRVRARALSPTASRLERS